MVVYRWEAPLFFANSSIFLRAGPRPRARAGVRAGWCSSAKPITDVDVTAADMLQRLDVELNAQGVHLAFVELRGRLRRPRVAATACDETLDRDHFYPSIEAALTDIAHVDSEPGPDDP